LLERCVLTSVSLAQLDRARVASGGQARLGWLVTALGADELRGAQSLGLFQLCPVADVVTPDAVEQALRIVPQVRAWGCPREPEGARRAAEHLAAAGCAGLTVDELGWFGGARLNG
jgi:glycerophosphoryl diester phosphodiesterase